jgi:hypothetical protein
MVSETSVTMLAPIETTVTFSRLILMRSPPRVVSVRLKREMRKEGARGHSRTSQSPSRYAGQEEARAAVVCAGRLESA